MAVPFERQEPNRFLLVKQDLEYTELELVPVYCRPSGIDWQLVALLEWPRYHCQSAGRQISKPDNVAYTYLPQNARCSRPPGNWVQLQK